MSENATETPKKKGFKLPSSFAILLLLIAVLAVLTWIIPSGQYDVTDDGSIIAGTYHAVAQTPQGLWDVIAAPVRGMLGTDATGGAVEVSVYVLVIGGFLGIVNKTGAIDAGIANVMKANKNNINRLIWILMFIFVLGGSTYGMGEETIAFYPILIPMTISLGFDALTATAIIFLGSNLGNLASTVNPFATGVASDAAGVGIGEGIVLRVIMFVVMWILGSIFVTRYATSLHKDIKNSLVYDTIEEQRAKFQVRNDGEKMSGKQKGVLALFCITFALMIIALIPWSDFNVSLFENFHNWLMGVPFLGHFVGTSLLPMGEWSLVEITFLFFAFAIIIGLYAGMSENEIVDNFIEGSKDLLSVALIIAVARGIQVVMNDGQITATILHWGESSLTGLSKGVFVTIASLFYVPLSFLIPSTSGLAAATMGIMAPLADFAGIAKSLMVTIYQTVAGLVNLVSPTSGILMGGLALAGINITTWWKFVWKFLVLISVISLAMMIAAAYL